jgi:hypothetical protein
VSSCWPGGGVPPAKVVPKHPLCAFPHHHLRCVVTSLPFPFAPLGGAALQDSQRMSEA